MEHSWRAAPLAGLFVILTLSRRAAQRGSFRDAGRSDPTARAHRRPVPRAPRHAPPTGSTGRRRLERTDCAHRGGAVADRPARMTGTAQRSGIKLAQDEINASGMLGKTRLEVIVGDDASQREQASAVFQRFIEDSHVVAIMGPTLSDAAQSVDPIAQQAAVPVLAISNSASGITQIGNYIFRDNLSESQLTPQVSRRARAHEDCTRPRCCTATPTRTGQGRTASRLRSRAPACASRPSRRLPVIRRTFLRRSKPSPPRNRTRCSSPRRAAPRRPS